MTPATRIPPCATGRSSAFRLFANMVAIDSSTWQGSVYNPEEGKIYTDVKVTLASRNQIVLKGCKAWLLCGEKILDAVQASALRG